MKLRKDSADKGAGSGCMARLVRFFSSFWESAYVWGIIILAIDQLGQSILNLEGIHQFLEGIGLWALVPFQLLVLGLAAQTLRNLWGHLVSRLRRTASNRSLLDKSSQPSESNSQQSNQS